MTDVASAIAAARAEPSAQNLEAMWRQVVNLPAWYLLPAALDQQTTPLVARLDDGDWIAAFTHVRALDAFAAAREMRSERGDLPMLALAPSDVVARVADLGDHVVGVAFNLETPLVFRIATQGLVEIMRRGSLYS